MLMTTHQMVSELRRIEAAAPAQRGVRIRSKWLAGRRYRDIRSL